MPDENKFDMLNEVCYTVRASCSLCQHGTFIGLSHWGTCAKHTYEHKKHTGDARQMSINVLGVCKTFEADKVKLARLQSFKNFFVGE